MYFYGIIPTMYTIIGKQNLTATIRRLDIRAEALVPRLKPGHFVAVMPEASSRPVPYNIFEVDWRRKCLSIVFEENDTLTRRMGSARINETIYRVAGPYGTALPVTKKGTVVFVGEGLAVAALLMPARAFKQAGNKVIGIAGFVSRKTSLFESQLRLNCDQLHVMYEDGMHDRKGDVLTPFRKVMASEPVACVYADVSPGVLAALRVVAAEKGVCVIANLMGFLDTCQAFYEDHSFFMGGRRYFPAVEGIFVDAQSLDFKEAVRLVTSTREYFACRKKELASSPRQGVFARLKKLFSA